MSCGKLPDNLTLSRIPFVLQRGDLLPQRIWVRQALVQATALKDANFDLGHIQLTRMFRRVMKLQALLDATGFGCRKGLVGRTRSVGIEIILDDAHLLGVGIAIIH